MLLELLYLENLDSSRSGLSVTASSVRWAPLTPENDRYAYGVWAGVRDAAASQGMPP